MPELAPDTVVALEQWVRGNFGISYTADQRELFTSRIAAMCREHGCDPGVLLLRLMGGEHAMILRLAEAVSTNHTLFFREEEVFDYLVETILPGLAPGPVRLWSAGCSSGEETWSLVLTLLGEDRITGKHIAARNLRVLASDIAAHALERANAATYPVGDLKDVPAVLRDLWTRSDSETATIEREARAMVRFRTLNLLGDWPMQRRFDTIFCRNVMIYFDQPTKERLVARFAEALVPGGHLYIGHSERVTGPAAALLSPVGPTIYRRKSA